MYFQIKGGTHATTFQEKVFITRKILTEGPDLKQGMFTTADEPVLVKKIDI